MASSMLPTGKCTLVLPSFSTARTLPRCPTASMVAPSPNTGDNAALLQNLRSAVRLALPSKGRMAEDTLNLLRDCQLAVVRPNPRQFVADIPCLPGLEVWFLRVSDVVRKIRTGDVDLGIVGYDDVCEHGQGDEDLIIVHDALEFGHCHLAMGVPSYGIFTNISSVAELAAMPHWTAERPLRIATGFTYLGSKFVKESGLKHAQLLSADGALEAAPAMGTADAILDLVGSGASLRENNLKQIDGGLVLRSQGVLVASKRALLQSRRALETTREILERLEAHLRAKNQFTVIAHMRGKSERDVAELILKGTDFHGFQVGGSGVLVSPLTYIFDEEPPRWRQLLDRLNL